MMDDLGNLLGALTAKVEWWEPLNKSIGLPKFIEGQAKGTMELRGGKVWVKKQGTQFEYANYVFKEQDVAMKAQNEALYGAKRKGGSFLSWF
jgi:hypothetical protein